VLAAPPSRGYNSAVQSKPNGASSQHLLFLLSLFAAAPTQTTLDISGYFDAP
jgi:hypothetical protein